MRIFRPAGVPTWLDAVLRSIERGMGDIWSSSLRLLGLETASLPDPADNRQGLIFDLTLERPVFSNGSSWVALESAIAAGTMDQYWRGDKTWQTLDKAAVGLGNVDNTSDATKAVLSASRLTTARSFAASGDGSWTVTFDGSGNVSAPLTLATVNTNTGTYGGAQTSAQISVDDKGRITGVAAVTITPAFSSLTNVPTTLAGHNITLTSGNVTTALGFTPQAASANLTTWSGIAPATGVGTFLATPTSANLLAMLTTKTGTGSNVFSINPTLAGASSNSAASSRTTTALGPFSSHVEVRATETAANGVGPILGFVGNYLNSNTYPVGSISFLHMGDASGGANNRTAARFRTATNSTGGLLQSLEISELGVKLMSYTVATLPSAATHLNSGGAGSLIYVPDEAGGGVLAFSDGTNWRRVTDRAVVA